MYILCTCICKKQQNYHKTEMHNLDQTYFISVNGKSKLVVAAIHLFKVRKTTLIVISLTCNMYYSRQLIVQCFSFSSF